jgi:hypothetical protein
MPTAATQGLHAAAIEADEVFAALVVVAGGARLVEVAAAEWPLRRNADREAGVPATASPAVWIAEPLRLAAPLAAPPPGDGVVVRECG